MDYNYIEQLTLRYWEGETTLEEDRILRTFYTQDNVPEHLAQYASYFRSLQALTQLEAPSVKARPLSITERIRPYFHAAAAVAIVALIGSGINNAVTQYHNLPEQSLQAQTNSEDTILTPLETLRNIQTDVKTASIDSLSTLQ